MLLLLFVVACSSCWYDYSLPFLSRIIVGHRFGPILSHLFLLLISHNVKFCLSMLFLRVRSYFILLASNGTLIVRTPEPGKYSSKDTKDFNSSKFLKHVDTSGAVIFSTNLILITELAHWEPFLELEKKSHWSSPWNLHVLDISLVKFIAIDANKRGALSLVLCFLCSV